MIDAEEAWAKAAMRGAPDKGALRLERNEARDAYRKIADQL
jgi:hypothetical protein